MIMNVSHILPLTNGAEQSNQNGLLQDLLNSEKLVNFLGKIFKGYRTDVAYHNDLHGLDVAQMLYMMIKEGQLAEVA